ncbi:MAG: tetratricopeptide repeat protein [Longimicrobiales bacterium]|nr:tetratricopeptide repeat protein [Longimicrobiales bacterium]
MSGRFARACRTTPPCIGALVVMIAGCSTIDTDRVIESAPAPLGDPLPLAESAESAFAREPREPPAVRDAFARMSEATRGTEPGDSLHAAFATRAARYAVWLANHLDGGEEAAYADSAILFANTAIRADSTRAAPYYWRSIASGIVARHNQLSLGRDAMHRIRADATRAIEIDPAIEHAGPHRVLGALYLRAPGPPSGLGSVARAVRELEAAIRLAPDYPENRLLLAEAYLRQERLEEARELLRPILAGEIEEGDVHEVQEWMERARELEREIRRAGQGTR